ncbi:NAD(P)H-quinone oxidoreductase subunit 6 [Thermostichus sp. MS-CIW-21]|jgi:NAD(P)H-quinone oxidoreductase subunit 6|uniref:NADH-quinone oxidoreductase subunit J n=1 Tax=unclassified Synechococcus TaxID=2626047 RepID=UPI00006944B9|nr:MULTISPECIES: NADH-quinone oxidoreductase subunit J [unclassified Synechococcus]ABC99791.1 NADH-ubiquinone/plastoquinone oxidoreductase, subunit 6 [Synechococcus sp. JA-3-3Ab]PIK87271.1 NADH:ubiquinone oxidoreductase subunit J [Synechococcus sp. 63AY4M2]PIK92626.1 NADH:ubiquinone oxidoreductase subunit J [Synechococcus sp. 65AY6Li]PIK93983.1 NADH:ubiquinone oxidoreductase subunit J [Synechococcus sp. 60AY4M2]PIK98568.1 NADH:ubiquinone oxidoreductase subunit J [Synechococcus sp. 63AY4M1]
MTLAEGVQLVTFGVLSAMAIGFALGVVWAPNIVYSGFLLGGVFLSMAGLYLLLNADFVAAAQVLIYVGAVNVLILFAIMLVNRRYTFAPLKLGWLRNGVTAAVCLGLFALLTAMALNTPWQLEPIQPTSSALVMGGHFFSDYLLPFELASVLLLMALIGAIVLARREFVVPQAQEGDLSLLERARPQLESESERPAELVSTR